MVELENEECSLSEYRIISNSDIILLCAVWTIDWITWCWWIRKRTDNNSSSSFDKDNDNDDNSYHFNYY